MKKCYFILGLILATSTAAAAPDKNFAKTVQTNVKNFCIQMFNEGGAVKQQAKMKAFCNKVANCVVNNAPNNYALQDSSYMESAMMQCIANEAENL